MRIPGERSEDEQSPCGHQEIGPAERPSDVLLFALADLAHIDPTAHRLSVPPSEVIDLDALHALMSRYASTQTDRSLVLTFKYKALLKFSEYDTNSVLNTEDTLVVYGPCVGNCSLDPEGEDEGLSSQFVVNRNLYLQFYQGCFAREALDTDGGVAGKGLGRKNLPIH